jgi:hypothetical protein
LTIVSKLVCTLSTLATNKFDDFVVDPLGGVHIAMVDIFDLNKAPSNVQTRYNGYYYDSTKIIPVSSLTPFYLPGGTRNYY